MLAVELILYLPANKYVVSPVIFAYLHMIFIVLVLSCEQVFTTCCVRRRMYHVTLGEWSSSVEQAWHARAVARALSFPQRQTQVSMSTNSAASTHQQSLLRCQLHCFATS